MKRNPIYAEIKAIARDQHKILMKVMELGSDHKDVQKLLKKYAKRVLNEKLFLAIMLNPPLSNNTQ